MNTFYDFFATEFEAQIADLRPTDAYEAIQKLAANLANDGFSSIPARFAIPITLIGQGTRNSLLWKELGRAYGLYSQGVLHEAFEITRRVTELARLQKDPLSEIDALHLEGRIHFDSGRFTEAEACFAEEMDLSQRCAKVQGFVRAIHEASRVRAEMYDLLRAEFGIRFAWNYYTASMILGGPQAASNDASGSDWQNVQAALRYLESLSEIYTSFERGATGADDLIQKLASPHLSTRDESGTAFWETRALATMCFASIPGHRPILARMASRALRWHRDYPRMSSFLLEEAEFVADLSGDPFPGTVRRVLDSSVGVRPLRSAPFYKPYISAVLPAAAEVPFGSPDSAARDDFELYRYLKEADQKGRYVYRGQAANYPGPLLPSAYRPILTDDYGRTTKSATDPLYARFSLRKCGRQFYGEYNSCFQQYANPAANLVKSGMSQQKVEATMRLYQQIFEKDLEISLAQEGESYVPWIDALRRVLSAAEFEIFLENKSDWMLRINNYHRRLYRMKRFIALFGCTLGTTFAQQYGFSSEGLDATKSLDVAFFFATRDSADFASIVNKGIGVIYRFPFPPNDVSASPLDKYNYYNLPSIVDVRDVIYRFETHGLARSDSRTCLDTYIGASLIDGFQDQNLLFLPEGFYDTTRVAKQEAVIIFPDEIREDHMDRKPGIGGIRFPKYRYIEDLATREGVQKFYFKHTGSPLNAATSIIREDLWPRDDYLLDMVVRIILATYRMRHKHPKRPELIDVGFDNEAFAKEACERYWADRPAFFSEDEKLGLEYGTLIL